MSIEAAYLALSLQPPGNTFKLIAKTDIFFVVSLPEKHFAGVLVAELKYFQTK